MTNEARIEALTAAKDGPLLLSGAKARFLVICGALLAAAVPYLTFIPQFDGWRDVIAWIAGFASVLIGVLIAGLVPKQEQEWYRQALVDSEAQRRAVHAELQLYRSSGGIARPKIGDPQ